ncbi:hypothetical protein KFK09_028488 [Dendrobium nobile]|uniref:Ubiquitin-like protease family profile domain-containing protein n=1 Tax=Dendrobium nobile TaxID=94219 RepID=A0A8T3A3G2_DENNO|nr:hypothetical protein KFK09_028488 [Dendrobium nobile]
MNINSSIFKKFIELILALRIFQVKGLYSDTTGAFDSDIRKWKLSTIKGIPKQQNSFDCGMYVCKYMERIILEGNTDWTDSTDWQQDMPKYRAEFAYEVFCKTLSK